MQENNLKQEIVNGLIEIIYKEDLKSKNALICLFKSNIDNSDRIKTEKDVISKFKIGKGYESQFIHLLKTTNRILKDNKFDKPYITIEELKNIYNSYKQYFIDSK